MLPRFHIKSTCQSFPNKSGGQHESIAVIVDFYLGVGFNPFDTYPKMMGFGTCIYNIYISFTSPPKKKKQPCFFLEGLQVLTNIHLYISPTRGILRGMSIILVIDSPWYPSHRPSMHCPARLDRSVRNPPGRIWGVSGGVRRWVPVGCLKGGQGAGVDDLHRLQVLQTKKCCLFWYGIYQNEK